MSEANGRKEMLDEVYKVTMGHLRKGIVNDRAKLLASANKYLSLFS